MSLMIPLKSPDSDKVATTHSARPYSRSFRLVTLPTGPMVAPYIMNRTNASMNNDLPTTGCTMLANEQC